MLRYQSAKNLEIRLLADTWAIRNDSLHLAREWIVGDQDLTLEGVEGLAQGTDVGTEITEKAGIIGIAAEIRETEEMTMEIAEEEGVIPEKKEETGIMIEEILEKITQEIERVIEEIGIETNPKKSN